MSRVKSARCFWVFAIVLTAFAAAVVRAEERPNIVLILADDND
jgi:hypothetical protein